MASYDIENQAVSSRLASPLLEEKRLNTSSAASFSILAFFYSYLNRVIWFLRHYTAGKIIVLLATVYVTVAIPFYLFSFDSSDLNNPFAFSGDGSKKFSPADGFDPKTAPLMLRQLGKGAGLEVRLPFQWRDWIDLSAADDWENADILPFSEKRGDLSKYSFPLLRLSTEEQQAMVGKVYLDNLAAIPDKVVFLGKQPATFPVMSHRNRNHTGFFNEKFTVQSENDVKEQEQKEDQLKSVESEDAKTSDQNQNQKRSPGQAPVTLPPILPELSTDKPFKDRIFAHLTMDHFILNLDKLERAGDEPDATDEQKEHAAFIKAARPELPTSKKHFFEVSLANDPQAFGVHYDWRFFNFVRHDREHKQIMHHLMRAWSQFAAQENILYWIAHGSLLGWYWDGISMPWDTDNDIQMPVQELDRFARMYNGTLVIEDETEGTGRYLIDVSPWYIERERGNGNNVIDARFIDVRSGIYIDITGLALVRDDNQVNCKNNHVYPLSRLSPLRKSLYEGAPVYVPHDYESTLYQEYTKYRDTEFRNWVFNRDLRMWVDKNACAGYKQRNLKFDDRNELTMYGACNKEEIFNDYQNTKEVTLAHSQEIDLYNHYGMIDTVEVNEKKELQPQIAGKLAALFDKYYVPQLPDPEPVERFGTPEYHRQALPPAIIRRPPLAPPRQIY
jgi:hypothetical protein